MVLVTLNDEKPILLSTSCVITLSRTSNNSSHKNVYFSFAESEKSLRCVTFPVYQLQQTAERLSLFPKTLWNTAGSIRSVLLDTPPFKTNSLTVHFNPVSRYQMCRNVFWKPLRPCVCVLLTVEGQVSEQSSQQIHHKHSQKRHIRNVLHLPPGTTADGKLRERVSLAFP